MSQSERQVQARPTGQRIQDLRTSAHLMTLDAGTFCLVNGSGKSADDVISGVRVSVTDPADSNVTMISFRSDGWLAGGDAALIRVQTGPAQVLVTIYQPVGGTIESAPKVRILRLLDAGTAAAIPAVTGVRRPVMVLTEPHDIIAHIQRTGDTGRSFGEWVGLPGSQMAIEGFSLSAPKDLEPGDLTYQAVLGRGWMSPWSESGQFCGSRGMSLPILGLRVKLSSAAAERYDFSYSATFLDGTKLDGLGSDDSCETSTLAALEAMRIELNSKLDAKAPAETTEAAAPGKGKKAPGTPMKLVSKAAKGSKATSRQLLAPIRLGPGVS